MSFSNFFGALVSPIIATLNPFLFKIIYSSNTVLLDPSKTTLDEINVNSYDFSMYHDLNCKLGLLSGTNNIIDSIAFANSLILAQYMKEN